MKANSAAPVLSGAQGELVTVTYEVDPKHLEDFLEALASVSFPVNPQLYHHPHTVTVEFPAYSDALAEVRQTLTSFGFALAPLKFSAAL